MESFLSSLKKIPSTDYIIIAINIVGALVGTIIIASLKPGRADTVFNIFAMSSKLGGIPMVAGIILCFLAMLRPRVAQLNVLQIYDFFLGLLMILSGAMITILPSYPLGGFTGLTYFMLVEAALLAIIQNIYLRRTRWRRKIRKSLVDRY
jgi:hypothetical protein